jgi:hypothetical protein
MCSDRRLRSTAVLSFCALALTATAFAQKVEDVARRFFPDDPLWQDSDALDIPPVEEFSAPQGL